MTLSSKSRRRSGSAEEGQGVEVKPCGSYLHTTVRIVATTVIEQIRLLAQRVHHFRVVKVEDQRGIILVKLSPDELAFVTGCTGTQLVSNQCTAGPTLDMVEVYNELMSSGGSRSAFIEWYSMPGSTRSIVLSTSRAHTRYSANRCGCTVTCAMRTNGVCAASHITTAPVCQLTPATWR